jgi:predicted nucleic acid-binding protein
LLAELFIPHLKEEAFRSCLVNSLELIQLAHEFACSAYDSEFISLAKNNNCKLVTADKKILRTFPEIAISARDFVATEF